MERTANVNRTVVPFPKVSRSGNPQHDGCGAQVISLDAYCRQREASKVAAYASELLRYANLTPYEVQFVRDIGDKARRYGPAFRMTEKQFGWFCHLVDNRLSDVEWQA